MANTVVLDVDGTLMDTNYLHTEAWVRAFEEVGHRVTRVELHGRIVKDSELLIREFVDEADKVEKIQELHSGYFADLEEHGHPPPGAGELIDSLIDAGHAVWFVTSAKAEEPDAEGKISGVVNSSDVENAKPAPDVFEEALKRTGASADETVAVGATLSGTWSLRKAPASGRWPCSPAGHSMRKTSGRPAPWRCTKTAPSC